MNNPPTNVNGPYAPFGVNDNNFNRIKFPSNVYPPHGGMSGDPNDNFDPMTTNYIQSIDKYASFDKAFLAPKPIYEKLDFRNKRETLHDNIGENVLDEHVVEYKIIIDSIDRDIKTYPDPFTYMVKFNAVSSFGDYTGAPKPHIGKQFENVKYIKLESIILPQHSKIKYHDKKFVFDPESRLPSERFVSLIIKELNNERILTTFQDNVRTDGSKMFTPQTPFSIIIPDKLLGFNYYTGISYYGSKVYKSSLLGTITQLQIQFADSLGRPLKFNDIFTHDDLEQYEFNNGDPLSIDDLRHPLNERLQNCMTLVFGVVESQINTLTKFDT